MVRFNDPTSLQLGLTVGDQSNSREVFDWEANTIDSMRDTLRRRIETV
jgi:hypothetical protein